MRDFFGGIESGNEALAYENLQVTVERCLAALEGDPKRWFFRLYKTLLQEKDRINQLPAEQKDLLLSEIDDVLNVLVEWARPDGQTKNHGERNTDPTFSIMQERIHQLEKTFTIESREAEPLEINRLSLKDLANACPDRISIVKEGFETKIRFRADQTDVWQEVLLPKLDHFYYKGGLPRILLKIYCHADIDLLNAEIPMNDIDVIAWTAKNSIEKIVEEGLRLGADVEGIEIADQDLQMIFQVRDVDLNQCFFGKDGLVFSDRAKQAMETGIIHIQDPVERGLYGAESYIYQGVKMIKPRGLSRLFKFVVEDKADSFEQAKLNRQVDFGIYWLVLVRKMARKSDAGVLLNRLFEIGRRSGQVLDSEENIFDVIARVHAQFPFFRFDDAKQSEEQVVRWLAKKIGKMANRKFRITHGVPTDLNYNRTDGDEEVEQISLAGYQNDPAVDQFTTASWPEFVANLGQAEERKAA